MDEHPRPHGCGQGTWGSYKMAKPPLFPVWSRLHNWRFLGVLLLSFSITIFLVFWYVARVQTSLVQSTAINNAKLYSQVLAEFRSIYTSEVVAAARRAGLEVRHDYAGHEGAIPLPATLSMLLGQRLGQYESGAEARLYSPFPFQWRKAQAERHFDEFGQAAWEFLNGNVNAAFFRFENLQGRPVLRYATADVMRPSCVGCHNTHPDTPKSDWEVGDVRGVLEIILPMASATAHAETNLRGILFMLLGASVLCLIGIAWVFEKLRRNSESLQLMVTERTEELAEARDAALDASQAKSMFLANMSHEIRTPMNAVLGYAQILERDRDLSQDHRKAVKEILQAGRHLMALINNVLDISKIEAHAMELNNSTFDLDELIKNTTGITQQRCAHKGLELIVDNHCKDHQLRYGDEGKIRQVLVNLMGNAVKFTETGCVTLSVHDSGERVYFSVSDTGVGIAEEDRIAIFEPFRQGNVRAGDGGTGLGLAITKEYIHLMGGELLLESSLDEGSRFSFSLPLPSVQQDRPRRPVDERVISRLAPGVQVTALVADDVEANRSLLATMLRQVGITVFEVADGQQAIDQLALTPCDIVYLDIRMPEVDGETAFRRIREMFPARTVRCVAVTASSLKHESQHYLEMGFDEYISKPYQIEAIYASLQRLLEVEFEYRQASPVSPPRPIANLEQICLPGPVYRRLAQAIELYRVSEIRSSLDEITGLGANEKSLAEQMDELLSQYDMDGLAAILEEIGHDQQT